MAVREIIRKLDEQMKKSIDFVHSEFAGIRTGKASPALVENMLVPYYGTPTRMRELAGISTPDPKTIVIQPWDVNAVAEVEKTILKSDLGLTPVNDGKIIRISIPPLTEDRRKELGKLARKSGEEAKVAVAKADMLPGEKGKILRPGAGEFEILPVQPVAVQYVHPKAGRILIHSFFQALSAVPSTLFR